MSDFPKMNSSRIISKVLSPALQLWLRSQVEDVDSLHLEIQGEDRQILGGYIPTIYILSKSAIYRGLHLGRIEILSQNIRINIRQILRGKPFRLLEPIQISGKVVIDEMQLQTSLDSIIFSNALNDLLFLLLESNGVEQFKDIVTQGDLIWQKISLDEETFRLQGSWNKQNHQTYPFDLVCKMNLLPPVTLELSSIKCAGLPYPYEITLTELTIDLGANVELSHFALTREKLMVQGKALIQN